MHCHYTVRLWGLIKEWLGIYSLDVQWPTLSLEDWWHRMIDLPNRKAISSLTLLATWEIWNGRNAIVFHNKQAHSKVLLDKIKKEVKL
jgi:hypothetical protein